MKANQKKSKLLAFPARIIAISFAMVILIGATLLTFPFSSNDGLSTGFLEALFTATSATCVTGLVVFDTFTKWSSIGQVIILTLIQIGGLGLVTLTIFFNVIIGRKLGFKGIQLAKESINSNSEVDIIKIVKMVVVISILVEFIGALLLCTVFVPQYGSYGLFMSVFLAISAFCNAGFDVLGMQGEYSSLMNYNNNFTVIFTISALIIIGGLGFAVWYDFIAFVKCKFVVFIEHVKISINKFILASPFKTKVLNSKFVNLLGSEVRENTTYAQTKKLMLHTKIVIGVTIILLIVGFVGFFLLEWNNEQTLGSLSFIEKINASLFQSVSSRTAGFNSVDIAAMNDSTKLLFIVLMFIGAAPGSTGGGIKITTITVLVMTVVCVIKGSDETILLRRKINKQTVYKSFAIISISLIAVVLASTVMSTLVKTSNESFSAIDVVFEAVSAFSTVGLSAGVTANTGIVEKIVLIFCMFLGRVGPVSFALSLAMRSPHNRKEILPESKILVG